MYAISLFAAPEFDLLVQQILIQIQLLYFIIGLNSRGPATTCKLHGVLRLRYLDQDRGLPSLVNAVIGSLKGDVKCGVEFDRDEAAGGWRRVRADNDGVRVKGCTAGSGRGIRRRMRRERGGWETVLQGTAHDHHRRRHLRHRGSGTAVDE
jgi:hypothetical protein